jgi:hypothetical protein
VAGYYRFVEELLDFLLMRLDEAGLRSSSLMNQSA